MIVKRQAIQDPILIILLGIVLIAYHTWIFYSYPVLDMIRVQVRMLSPLMLILFFKKYTVPQGAKIPVYLYCILIFYLLLVWAFSESPNEMALQTAKNLYILIFFSALLLILHPKNFSYRFLYIIPYLGLIFSIQAIGLTGLSLIDKTPSDPTDLIGPAGRLLPSYGLWGYALEHINTEVADVIRAQGFFGEPTALASFLEVAAILSLGLYKVNNDKKMLIVFILCGVAMIFTFSPTMYIVMFLVVSIFYYITHFQRIGYLRLLILFGLVSTVTVVIVFYIEIVTGSFYESPLGRLFGKPTVDISNRLRFIWDSLYMFSEHPFGIGFYGLDHPTAIEKNLLFGGLIAPLIWLTQGGIVALVIQICIIFYLIRNIVINQIRVPGRIERYIGLSVIAKLLHDCVAGEWFSALFFYLVASAIATDAYPFSWKAAG